MGVSSTQRGRWAVDLGGVLVRRRTLTGARRTARITGGVVRHWRHCRQHPISQNHAWESPGHPLRSPKAAP
jgi:hypothetical protein